MAVPRTCIPCPKIEDDCYDWYKRHEAKCEAVKTHSYDLVFIGDSLTHFWAGEDGVPYGTEVWNEFYGKRRALNLGFGFDRTQNVLWRLEHGELAGQSPKVFVVNIGTNQFSHTEKYGSDNPEDTAAGIRAVVEKLETMFPDAKIILMTLFPRGLPGDIRGTQVAETDKRIRSFAENNPVVTLIDLSDKLGFPDYSVRKEYYHECHTHLNDKGYRVWAEAIEPVIRQTLKENEK